MPSAPRPETPRRNPRRASTSSKRYALSDVSDNNSPSPQKPRLKPKKGESKEESNESKSPKSAAAESKSESKRERATRNPNPNPRNPSASPRRSRQNRNQRNLVDRARNLPNTAKSSASHQRGRSRSKSRKVSKSNSSEPVLTPGRTRSQSRKSERKNSTRKPQQERRRQLDFQVRPEQLNFWASFVFFWIAFREFRIPISRIAPFLKLESQLNLQIAATRRQSRTAWTCHPNPSLLNRFRSVQTRLQLLQI